MDQAGGPAIQRRGVDDRRVVVPHAVGDEVAHGHRRAVVRAGDIAEERLKDCAALLKETKEQNDPMVQDGLQRLQKSIELRPDYDDAMAYLNLLYREKADLECDNPDARKADLKTADDWVDKTMATKKAEAEKSGPTGIVTTESTQ